MSISQTFKDIQRLRKISSVLIKEEFSYFVNRVGLNKYIPFYKKIKIPKTLDSEAVRLRRVFDQLGGTFIKLGQLLSLRPDLIPREYIEEFSKLQDKATPFSYLEVRRIIQEELKKPISQIFSYFDKKPIASASIGQVHRAKLRNGKEVVVKVQRPNIQKIMFTDIDLMYHLANLIKDHMDLNFNPVEIVEEFEIYTRKELDYITEGRHADKFYKNFKANNNIIIPKVHWDYTTKRVLTLDYIDGKKISEIDLNEKEKKRFAKIIAEFFLSQVLEYGFFQADPHPGNIFIVKDKIGLLDYGIIGIFGEDLKKKISELFISITLNDVNGVIDILLELGLVGEEVNIDSFSRELEDYLMEYYNIPIKQMDIGDVFYRLINISSKYKLNLPRELILLGKAIVTVESFGKDLDTEFNLTKISEPFVKELKKEKIKPRTLVRELNKSVRELIRFTSKLPRDTREIINRIKRGDFNITIAEKEINNLGLRIDKSGNRLSYGIIVAALILASPFLSDIKFSKFYNLPILSIITWLLAIFFGIVLIVSILREKREVMK